MYTPKDINIRNEIINNLDESFFVEAGAGSGKTRSVVDRMVSLILDDKKDRKVSEICAITFTKAAANEFYARFQNELSNRLLTTTDEKQKAKISEALQNIDLCFMGTIDAFCKKILEEHPFEAKIPSKIDIIDETANDCVEQLKSMYFSIRRKEEVSDELFELSEKFATIFGQRADSNFATIMNNLLDKAHFDIRYSKSNIDDIDKYLEENRLVVLDVIHRAEKYLVKDKNPFIDRLKVLNKKWHLYNLNEVVKALSNMDKNDFRLSDDFELAPPYDQYIGYETLSKKVYKHLDFSLISNTIEDYIYEISMDFCLKCIPIINEYRRGKGLLSFHDNLVILRDMLKKDASEKGKIIRQIQKRYKYFFLDEFQDTDPLQAQIFFYLSSEKINVDYKKCLPYHGSLFIVGDPKQSIYRFKGADINSFYMIKNLFIQNGIGQVVELVENFRSMPVLKEYFNNVFEEKFNEDSKIYSNIPVNHIDAKNKEGTTLLDGVYKDLYVDNKEKIELVTSLIKTYVHNPNYVISIKERVNNEDVITYRSLKYSDFMILTRGRTALDELIYEMKDSGIPYHCDGKIKFNACKSFKFVLDVMQAVAYKHHPIYLYNLLYSDYFALTRKELLDIYFNTSFLNVDIETITNSKIKIIFEFLIKVSKYKNPSELYKKIIESDVFKEFIDKSELQKLFYAYELLVSEETNNGINSLESGIEYLQALYENDDDLRKTMLLEEKIDAVHLANVHQVKGLEARFVILINSTSKTGLDYTIEYKDGENAICKVLEIDKKYDAISFKVIANHQFGDDVETENKLEQCRELDRLAYVAATRAINVLVVLSRGTTKGENYGGCYLNFLTDGISNRISNLEYDEEKEIKTIEGSTICESKLLEKVPELSKDSYQVILPSHTIKHSSFEDDDDIYANANDAFDVDAALVGTLVHKLLELLMASRDNIDPDNPLDIVSILTEYIPGVADENVVKELALVRDTIINGGYDQENEAPKDILNELRNAEEYYSEVPFCYKKEDKIYSGVMDVVYKKDGNWHIIDYKTNHNGRDLDEKYKEQLAIYKEALKVIMNVDADAKTYHIDLTRSN